MNPLVVICPLCYRADASITFRDQTHETLWTNLPGILQQPQSMNCHDLDEIIDEKLNNPVFEWRGTNGIASSLALDGKNLKQKVLTWNLLTKESVHSLSTQHAIE
jgi:hypothetical protein